MHEWAEAMENVDRHCAQTDVAGIAHVSTVFLGLDHSLDGGLPVLWETMVFWNHTETYSIGDREFTYHPTVDELDCSMIRYSSRDYAMVGHEVAVAELEASLLKGMRQCLLQLVKSHDEITTPVPGPSSRVP